MKELNEMKAIIDNFDNAVSSMFSGLPRFKTTEKAVLQDNAKRVEKAVLLMNEVKK